MRIHLYRIQVLLVHFIGHNFDSLVIDERGKMRLIERGNDVCVRDERNMKLIEMNVGVKRIREDSGDESRATKQTHPCN